MNKFNPDDNAVARSNTITELCAAWSQSVADISEAFRLIQDAQNRLNVFFDDGKTHYGMDVFHHRGNYRAPDLDKPEQTMAELQRRVWGNLVGRLELRKIMSLERAKELDKQLESGAGLPEITVPNIMAMLETTFNQAGTFMEEKVKECYERLRPHECGSMYKGYKTNQKSSLAGVGKKVVLGYAVRHNYRTKGFEVTHNRQDELRALDQVFHLLDGKRKYEGSWAGELCDAIGGQTDSVKNTFETPYFSGRCFRNGNIHLIFRRDDLLQQFNRAAGGARLTNPLDSKPHSR